MIITVGLSPLRSHKLRHCFEDTSTDICLCDIETEDTKHFLFSCPLYARQRAKLAATTITILTPMDLNHLANSESLYMYCHACLSDVENKNIINATITYLKETKRFS